MFLCLSGANILCCFVRSTGETQPPRALLHRVRNVFLSNVMGEGPSVSKEPEGVNPLSIRMAYLYNILLPYGRLYSLHLSK